VDSFLGLFGGRWVDDKPYETYKLSKYVTPGDYKGVAAALDPLTEESITAEAKLFFYDYGIPMDVADDPGKTEAAEGDAVLFSFEGWAEGIPEDVLENMKSDPDMHYTLILGSGAFIAAYENEEGVEERPSFEDQMIGQPRNQKFDVDVIFPDNYGAPGEPEAELNGKPVTFKCEIFKIGEEIVTDERVQMLTGGQLETAEEFLEFVENRLVSMNQQNAFIAAYENAEFTGKFPSREKKYWDEQLQQDALRQGISDVDEYVYMSTQGQYTGTAEDYRDDQIRREMFAYAIAFSEDLNATDEQVQELLDEIRTMYGLTDTDGELFSEYGGKGRILRSLVLENVAQFLAENAAPMR